MNVVVVVVLLCYALCSFGQGLVINEIMSANNETIQDADGNFEDWIELYNGSNMPINLMNYSLSDNAGNLQKWKFPSMTVLPNSFVLVFASSKNRLDTTELHTNFKIDAEGETLFLTNNNGLVINQIDAISLADDESYGRIQDGHNTLVRLNFASAGYSNNGDNYLVFSKDVGFYTSPFKLGIHSLLGDTIYYTLNGELPTTNSMFYLDSLYIENQQDKPNYFSEISNTTPNQKVNYKTWESPNYNIDKATVLRCASFRNGQQTSKVYTKTFFVDSNIMEKYKMPVISLVSAKANFFDRDTGIYVTGVHFDDNNPQSSGNYFQTGRAWERPVFISYFDEDKMLAFEQNAGVRIHGGVTRQATQKSLRLYARTSYGKNHFEYPLFPKRNNTKYENFILRTTMGAWGIHTMFNDELAAEVVSLLDVEFQDYKPVVVFLNGEYWGIHSMREYINEDFIKYSYDPSLDKDSINLDVYYNDDYNELLDFVRQNDLRLSANYEQVKQRIDMNNYIDYHIAEMFFSNYDWPSNNLKIWKYNRDSSKMRWIFYDVDAAFREVNYDMFQHVTSNNPALSWNSSPYSNLLFQNLLKNKEFEDLFIQRYAEMLHTVFLKSRTVGILNNLRESYESEFARHSARWHYPDSYSDWNYAMNEQLKFFLENRPCRVEQSLLNFFNREHFDFECIPPTLDKTLDFVLVPNPSDGLFYIYNSSDDDINANIMMVTTTGQVIYVEENVALPAKEKHYFRLKNQPSGTYFLKLFSDSFFEVKKFVLIR